MTRERRLKQLEAARQAWEAQHVPVGEVLGFLGLVLGAVQTEAGNAAFERVARRVIDTKTAQIDALQRGRA